MPLPLAGLRIVVARPAEQAADTVAALQAAGADVLALPTLDIAPLAAALPTPPAYTLPIFVSRPAVAHGAVALAGWHDRAVCAMGNGTASALREAGFRQVHAAETSEDSEGLLALPLLETPAALPVLIVRGESEAGGRRFLMEELARRGAQVQEFVCYRRAPRPFSAEEGAACAAAVTAGAWVQVGSREAFLALRDNVGAAAVAGVVRWLVPHPRVAAAIVDDVGVNVNTRCTVLPFAPEALVAAVATLYRNAADEKTTG